MFIVKLFLTQCACDFTVSSVTHLTLDQLLGHFDGCLTEGSSVLGTDLRTNSQEWRVITVRLGYACEGESGVITWDNLQYTLTVNHDFAIHIQTNTDNSDEFSFFPPVPLKSDQDLFIPG